MTAIAPSLLSCNFADMGNEIARMEQAGATWMHYDVMDGHFVPNLTIGPDIVRCCTKGQKGIADVHLMISDPLTYGPVFAKAGADYISFHIESDSDTAATIKAIRDAGAHPAVALKPATPAEAVFPYLKDLDMVLIMTVEPGFGGQTFMYDQMDKARAVRTKADELGLTDLHIEVDGGINEETVSVAAAAGCDILVSGSTVFKSPDPAATLQLLQEKADAAYRKDF